jgi:hypothetical protein
MDDPFQSQLGRLNRLRIISSVANVPAGFDAPAITLTGIVYNLVPETLGNIVGGAGLVGAMYWMISIGQPSARVSSVLATEAERVVQSNLTGLSQIFVSNDTVVCWISHFRTWRHLAAGCGETQQVVLGQAEPADWCFFDFKPPWGGRQLYLVQPDRSSSARRSDVG